MNRLLAVTMLALLWASVCLPVGADDKTVEGMEHLELPAFSVQYHPEASPGPHDASYLFRRFIDLIKSYL